VDAFPVSPGARQGEPAGGRAGEWEPPAETQQAPRPRWEAFRRELLELVNEARRATGVAEVVEDPEAAAFARAETQRLVDEGAFGHHAADGSKPYERWARRGGTAHVRENLFRLTAAGGRAYMRFDPAQAHARLMGSAGHRQNVLDPAHTGVGIGVAYDRARNSVYVVQEFVNRYLELEPGSARWRPGETRELRGRLLEGVPPLEPWMAVLYREPEHGGRTARREARRRSYREGSADAVLVLSSRSFDFDPASGGLGLRVSLPGAISPGTYTLILYLAPPEQTRARSGRRSTAQGIPASSLVFEVARW
jgi:uncharacterized protein YkwD